MTTAVRRGVEVLYRPRLQGKKRRKTAAQLREKYEAGCSVRSVADGAELSYGTAHRLLREAGTVMRDRAGRVPAGGSDLGRGAS
ncbi:helix-turn-helix domain-containing protein [Streptomyces sp. NPDC057456]|uniref:helix-turn-helix domain-containing protein n=1 Tax=Streptomyces sp. NPDC057456 TaxID=3346139 RepID=UPI0036A6AB8B